MTTATLEISISGLQSTDAEGLQQAFSEAGFTMAASVEDGFNLSALGLGNKNSGLAAMPHTNIKWSADQVVFTESV